MKLHIMRWVVLWLLLLWILVNVVHASQCIGAVVNGQCLGTIMPDYTQPLQQRPPDFFTPHGRGVPSSPTPGPAWDGLQFENRTKPVFPGGQLRWVDPRHLE